MNDCIFCKIVAGAVPSPRIYEDESFICIRDVRPQAKTHLLVIPKNHIVSLEECFPEKGSDHAELVSRLIKTGVTVARKAGLSPDGFRSVINTGKGGGQTVFHLHLHVMADQGES